ncbi:MAG: hypothetical protein H7Z40_02575 [Phycisphaerae bacterium]|nr:hypothetical protein [Gemmatimonadaceae bacterium]
MNTPNSAPRASRGVSRLLIVAAAMALAPAAAHAQSGKWVGTISQLSIGGAADITVDPRNDKQSRAKITLRNLRGRGDQRIAWDIVSGLCTREGVPIAPQATFTQVQTSMDGSGTASANVPKLESGKEYYIRIFDPQSVASDATAYGCANLSEKP